MDTKFANGSLEYNSGEVACKPRLVEAWPAGVEAPHIVHLVVRPVGHSRLVVAGDTVQTAPNSRTIVSTRSYRIFGCLYGI